jgi:hypothetical protein
MLFKNNRNILFIILICLVSCTAKKESKEIVSDNINFDHFNHLYKEINFNGKKVGIVHIYSEYPDYAFEIEPKEGFTCVDDVARAIVMLSKYLEENAKDEVALDKLIKLTEFVLQMQHENGYFNNFIWNDLSINTTYKTSVAELNWWSFRALWGLESAYGLLKSDKDMSSRIEVAIQKLLVNIKRDIPITDLKTETVETIEVPTWLPQKYAADQSAVLILGLLKNYERKEDNDINLLIDALAKGIMIMQKGNADNYPYGAFMSWQNLWHAWGNTQAYALLKVGQKFNNQAYIDSALMEIDYFYPYLLETGFAEAFWIQKTGDNIFSEDKRNKYPQITYGLRPMIWATSEAYSYSKNKKYLNLAKEIELWLYGDNDAQGIIYNPATGICFDGIKGKEEISKNSGAESTIESILILLEIKKLKKNE